MRASNGPLPLILFIICISDLNGLEAVIITPKSRFRGFEFDTQLVRPRAVLGPGPDDPRSNRAIVFTGFLNRPRSVIRLEFDKTARDKSPPKDLWNILVHQNVVKPCCSEFRSSALWIAKVAGLAAHAFSRRHSRAFWRLLRRAQLTLPIFLNSFTAV
jgi:hypothetical protein